MFYRKQHGEMTANIENCSHYFQGKIDEEVKTRTGHDACNGTHLEESNSNHTTSKKQQKRRREWANERIYKGGIINGQLSTLYKRYGKRWFDKIKYWCPSQKS